MIFQEEHWTWAVQYIDVIETKRKKKVQKILKCCFIYIISHTELLASPNFWIQASLLPQGLD